MNNIQELEKLNKTDLINKCKELNINKYSNKNKQELIFIIKNKLNNNLNVNDITNDNNEIVYIKPIIKYVGGKSQIIKKIIENFPDKIKNYHELFLGGGSVLLALLQNIEKDKIKVNGTINAYDINVTLINLYKNLLVFY